MTAPATSSGSSLQLSERLEPTSSPPVGTTTPPVESGLILDSSSILPSPVSIPRTNVSSLPPLTTIPSSNLDFNTDGVSFTPTTTPTQPSSVTARPTSLNSRPTDQLATPTPGFPLIESVSEFSSGSNGTAGLASAVDGSSIASKLVSTPTADSGAAGSPDSLPASSGSVLSATAGSPLESGSKSAGPTSLSGGLSADATGAISNGNGASLSSLTSSLPESSSRSEGTEPSVLGLTAAGNSGETGSFDKLFSGTVGSPSVENVVSSPSQLRSSPLPLDSSILPSDPSLPSSSLLMLSSSSSLEAERLTPLPAESTLSKDVLQLFPITDVSSDDSLSSGEDTDSNALGSNAMTFITVGTAAMVALMFGIFYLCPKRTNPHELLTPCEPPQPSNHTGAYPYNHSLELEAAGPYDAASTPRIDIIHTRLT
ncbi:unnamed protein product [Peronospora belbahrii]|uniref:REJ domain-containing protein n=1 Tax=Peronospora belbahrii TaxID=622444 RepID=A0ABN8D9H8_9STRA|nr:unnamed protein product [Peronospora belbahrii]